MTIEYRIVEPVLRDGEHVRIDGKPVTREVGRIVNYVGLDLEQ